MISSQSNAGAWSKETAMTPEVQSIVDKVKNQIQAKINLAMDINKGISFSEQIVNGKNYRILIHATKYVYIAVQVYCKPGDSAHPQVTEIFENSLTMSKNFHLVGGWTEVHFPADPDIQRLVDQVKPQVETRVNKKFESFLVLEWITRVTNAFNYRVRIQTNEKVPLVIEFIIRPFPGASPELSQIIANSLTVDQNRLLLASEGAQRLGGWSEDRVATKDVQAIVDVVKRQVEEKTQLKLTINKALIYALQVTGAFNYRIWIHANESTYLAIQVVYSVNIPLLPMVTEVFENSLTMSNNSSGLGAWSHEKPNDKEITKLALEVRPQAETKTGKKFSMFEVIVYIEQLVQGTNYRARVQIDADNYITIQFHMNHGLLGAQPKLTEIISSSLAGGNSSRVGLSGLAGSSNIVLYGGWSDEKAPTKEIQEIANIVKSQIADARKIDMNFNTVLSYCEQLFYGGWNYRILIQANEADFVAYQVYTHWGDEKSTEVTEIFENSLTMGPNYPIMSGGLLKNANQILKSRNMLKKSEVKLKKEKGRNTDSLLLWNTFAKLLME